MAESRTVSIKGRIAGLNALQRGLLNKVAISQKVRAKTQTVAKKFLRILKQNHFSGPTSDTVLGARTGKLKKALGFQVAVAAGRFQGIPTIRYGSFAGAGKTKLNRILAKHKKGGFIFPSKKQLLAVPVGPRVLTAGGRQRFGGPRSSSPAPYNLGPYTGTLKRIPIRSGGDVVARLVDYEELRRNNWDQVGVQSQYLLMRKVRVPKRDPLGAFRKEQADNIKQAMTEVFMQVLNGKR